MANEVFPVLGASHGGHVARPCAAFSLRKIAKNAGISVGTARDVRERIRREDDPALPRQHPKSPTDTTGPTRLGPNGSRATVDRVDHIRFSSIFAVIPPCATATRAGLCFAGWASARSAGQTRKSGDQQPPHCAIVVARVARGSAIAWTDFAEALDERVRECAC
jgi:hypothetical protein